MGRTPGAEAQTGNAMVRGVPVQGRGQGRGSNNRQFVKLGGNFSLLAARNAGELPQGAFSTQVFWAHCRRYRCETGFDLSGALCGAAADPEPTGRTRGRDWFNPNAEVGHKEHRELKEGKGLGEPFHRTNACTRGTTPVPSLCVLCVLCGYSTSEFGFNPNAFREFPAQPPTAGMPWASAVFQSQRDGEIGKAHV